MDFQGVWTQTVPPSASLVCDQELMLPVHIALLLEMLCMTVCQVCNAKSTEGTMTISKRRLESAGLQQSPSRTWSRQIHASIHLLSRHLQCRVAVLDGGYPAWQAEGYEVDNSAAKEHEVQDCARAAASPVGRHRYRAEKDVSCLECLTPLYLFFPAASDTIHYKKATAHQHV